MMPEMIDGKKRTVGGEVMLASAISRQLEDMPNLVTMAELAIRRAGIAWEWIDVASIALPPIVPSHFVKAFKKQYQNTSVSKNLIYALAAVRKELLETNNNCCFGLTLVVEAAPNLDHITVGAMVLKKPDYVNNPTLWLQPGVVSLILNSNNPDIVKTTLDNVNKELRQREEPSICPKDVMISGSLARFFRALCQKDNLAMLVLPNQDKTRSSILIQT